MWKLGIPLGTRTCNLCSSSLCAKIVLSYVLIGWLSAVGSCLWPGATDGAACYKTLIKECRHKKLVLKQVSHVKHEYVGKLRPCQPSGMRWAGTQMLDSVRRSLKKWRPSSMKIRKGKTACDKFLQYAYQYAWRWAETWQWNWPRFCGPEESQKRYEKCGCGRGSW